MKKINALALTVGVSLSITLLASCGCCKATKESQALDTTSWEMTSMDGHDNSAFAEPGNFTLQFNAAENQINGAAACNRYFGSYEQKEKTLNISMGGSTKMACPNMDLEHPFFIMLDEADSYEIKKGELILYKGEKKVATFGKVTK